MRVGLLTFHHVANYGAALQAVALQRTLERHGHTVEVIDYRPSGAREHYRHRWYPVRARGRRLNRRFAHHALKALRFDRFTRQHLHLGPRQRASGAVRSDRGFDAVVVGSDQVWDITSRIRGFDPAYFLDDVPAGVRRVAYAPSFGATGDVGPRHAELRRLLARFDAVAARDANTIDLTRSLGRADVSRAADPTCLEPLWDLAADPGSPRPYLLLYAEQRLEAPEAAAVRRIADERGLQVVAVGFSHPVADRSIVAAGPRQWLGWVQHADYLVTSMFHGTIFGVLAGTPLTVLMRPGRAHKLGDLLTSLDLWDRVGPDGDRTAWDPAPAQRRMQGMAARSDDLLRTVLDGSAAPPAGRGGQPEAVRGEGGGARSAPVAVRGRR